MGDEEQWQVKVRRGNALGNMVGNFFQSYIEGLVMTTSGHFAVQRLVNGSWEFCDWRHSMCAERFTDDYRLYSILCDYRQDPRNPLPIIEGHKGYPEGFDPDQVPCFGDQLLKWNAVRPEQIPSACDCAEYDTSMDPDHRNVASWKMVPKFPHTYLMGEHSEKWMTVAEIEAYPWQATHRITGVIARNYYEIWQALGGRAVPSHFFSPDSLHRNAKFIRESEYLRRKHDFKEIGPVFLGLDDIRPPYPQVTEPEKENRLLNAFYQASMSDDVEGTYIYFRRDVVIQDLVPWFTYRTMPWLRSLGYPGDVRLIVSLSS